VSGKSLGWNVSLLELSQHLRCSKCQAKGSALSGFLKKSASMRRLFIKDATRFDADPEIEYLDGHRILADVARIEKLSQCLSQKLGDGIGAVGTASRLTSTWT